MKAPETGVFEDGEETMVFCSSPDKETRKLLSVLKVKVVVKKLTPGAGKNEILVCGGGPVNGLKQVLAQLGLPAPVEHRVPKSDLSEQLWVCGSYAVRLVTCTKDLFDELDRRKHPLCLIDEQNITVRSVAGRQPADGLAATCAPLEAVPKCVKMSAETKFVITCHVKGHGVSAGDRAKYLGFPQVVRVMGRTDSVANRRLLLTLVRRLYRQ